MMQLLMFRLLLLCTLVMSWLSDRLDESVSIEIQVGFGFKGPLAERMATAADRMAAFSKRHVPRGSKIVAGRVDPDTGQPIDFDVDTSTDEAIVEDLLKRLNERRKSG